MESHVRRILDRDDLAAIHRGGVGFVLYPFGRKVHSARCPSVPEMALNPSEPRWFAPDVTAARAYQSERLARYPTARPFETVRCCAALAAEAVITQAGAARRPAPAPLAHGLNQDWTIRSSGRSVELWTTTRTPFGADQSPEQKAMVQALTPDLASLSCGPGERLHGVFVSDELASRQPDAENIAFYNFGSAPFIGAGAVLGFERSYIPAPPPPHPLDAPARFFHRWSIVADDAPFDFWREADVVATWDVPIDPAGDLGLAAWRALREHPEAVEVHGQLTAMDPFAIEVELVDAGTRRPSIVGAIKGLVDGPIAGLQRADDLDPVVVARLLSRRWGRPIDEPTLRSLASAVAPPPVLPRGPFNRNGLDPCDELCVAGIARIVRGQQVSRMRGRAIRVQAA